MSEMASKDDLQEKGPAAVEAGSAPGADASQAAAEMAQWQEMLAGYRRAVAKDPRNVELLNELGRAAESAGDTIRARWAYKRAMRLEPDYAASYLNLAHLDRTEGRIEQAISGLQEYISLSGRNGDVESVVAELREMMGQGEADHTTPCAEAPGCDELAEAWEELGLTPAEAMVLLEPEETNGRRMMSYTLLDLTMRGVLEFGEGNTVGRGENYDESRLRPHEALFAKYFARYDEFVDLDRLTRAAAGELHNRFETFESVYVRQSLVQKGYMNRETRRILFLIPVQQFVLTPKGRQAQERLKRLMKRTNRQVQQAIKRRPDQAKAYLSGGGPPILLLEEYPTAYFREWEQRLNRMGFGPAITRLRQLAQAQLDRARST